MRSLPLFLAALLASADVHAQDVVWSTTSTPSTGGAFCSSVLPLPSGEVLGVRSRSSSFNPFEWFLLDADGDEVLTTTLDPSAGYQRFTDLVSDGSGGALLLVTAFGGSYGGASLGSFDAVVLRLGPDGQLISSQRFGGGGRDSGRALAADGAGGFYLAGSTDSASFGTPTGAAQDAFVAHVEANGAVNWVRREGSAGLSGHMDCLALDGSGKVLCGGAFDDSSTFPVVPMGFAVRYDAGGTRQFFHSIHPAGGDVVAIEPTSTGYIELAFDPFGGYYCTARDSSGTSEWGVTLDASGASSSQAVDLVRRGDGTFLIGGSVSLPPTTQHIRNFVEGGAVLFDRSCPVPGSVSSSLQAFSLDGQGSVYVGGSSVRLAGNQLRSRVDRIQLDAVGAVGCAGQPNSAGPGAATHAVGSDVRSDNALTIFTDSAPPFSLGYYLASRSPGFAPGAGGSQGDLCLGGAVGRLNRADEIRQASANGRFHLRLDLGSLPSPTGTLSAMAGETWRFQAWYRDANPLPTSNFSGSIAVPLL